jgi:predicted TPR repeat methyltransferase
VVPPTDPPHEHSHDDWLVSGSADSAEVVRRYDGWAASYDAELAEWAYEAPDVVADFVVGQGITDGPVLDAGCGTGLVGRALRRAGYRGEIEGLDASSQSLAVARASGEYRSLEVADLRRPLDIGDDRFGGLTCVGVMTYLSDVEACWREFARVVRPGGVIAVTQRDDLWADRGCQDVIDRLAADDVWAVVEVTGPRPYLPRNAGFGDAIGVRYVVTRAGGAP